MSFCEASLHWTIITLYLQTVRDGLTGEFVDHCSGTQTEIEFPDDTADKFEKRRKDLEKYKRNL